MPAIAKRTLMACALVAFGLITCHTPAFAKYRLCSIAELNHVSGYNIQQCLLTGNSMYCDAESGAARCCGRSGNSLACGEILTTRDTDPPPGVRPPTVKLDIPPVRGVSPPPKVSLPPRVDIPPASVAPVKPPTGPIVR
jgi:hypothetical protein